MSDTSDAPLSLTRGKKILGMPRVVFILVAGGVLGGAWYLYNKHKTATAAITPTATPFASTDTTSSKLGSAGSGGSNPAYPTGASTYPTNAAWAQAGANYLSTQGVTPTDASNALSNYLNGTPLTSAQQTIVNTVQTALGAPPQGIISSTSTPGSIYAPPTVVSYIRFSDGTIAQKLSDGTYLPLTYPQWAALGLPKYTQVPDPYTSINAGSAFSSSAVSASQALASSGAPTGSVLYTIQPGDSLQSISARFYNSPNQWPTIYQANKAVIGSNPDVLRIGSNLQIPNASSS